MKIRAGNMSTARHAGKLIFFLVLTAGNALAQQGPHVSRSDVAEANLSRVAATAEQIEQVLRKEPALMLELKRWIANEATQRSQIVEDTDLTDVTIIFRLRTDAEFRGVATRLVQRYGFLVPRVNPESDLAKQNELVLQEKAKLIAKSELEGAQNESRTRLESANDQRDETPGSKERRVESRRSRGSQRDVPERRNEAGSEEPRSELPLPSVASSLTTGGTEADRERAMLIAQAGTTSPVSSPRATALAADSTRFESLARTNDLLASRAESDLDELSPQRRRNRSRGKSGLTGSGTTTDSSELYALASPYRDIPALYDLYRQAAPRPVKLERFGREFFADNSDLEQQLPADLPVGPDYVVGSGDGLAIDIWGGISQRLQRTVDREGRIQLPEVGPFLVSGRTMGEIQRTVQQLLRTQYRDISVDVSLSRLRTIRVYVVGDVTKPGPYEVSSLSTPLNALFLASGPTEQGSLRTVRHMRNNQLVQEVDIYDLLLRGIRSDLKRLENGDTLLIPPLGKQVRIEGLVRRPAIYELRGEKSLADVLDLAGGVLPTATLHNIQVQRLDANEKRTMLSVQVEPSASRNEIERQLAAFQIRDNDEVRIFPIAVHNESAVYLSGHVLRPGKYSFRPGMRTTDLITSFKDLLAEPSLKYAEIIRLNPPDYRPSVESFNLGAALGDPSKAPLLQAMDTVQVFSRFDFEDPPAVWVGGEVNKPGAYPTPGQIRLRDAIHLAGGTAPDAWLANVQVFRYLPDSNLKIFSVNLESALEGNPADNIPLANRDRVVVHRNPAKVDPATIFIKGEVAKPGRYPLTTNMRIADLIQLAGGLKRSASIDMADLTRFSPGKDGAPAGVQMEIPLRAALSGDPAYSFALEDGDTLSIRQIPGWNDIGASVEVSGEMQHPGTYGIRPGEKLSSVLLRAGGYRSTAFPQGILLERLEVREFQQKSRQELISRIEQESANTKVALSSSAQDQAVLQQAALLQKQRVLEGLRQTPVSGRLVVRLLPNLKEFAKSSDDIELRAGDRILIPKKPNFVIVTGQVYISNAITFVPRKSAAWYLQRAGGPTDLADKKNIFILRASGEVLSGEGGGWWAGGVLSQRIQPGDTIVVPEKPLGGSTAWKNILTIAQVASSAAISAAVLTR